MTKRKNQGKHRRESDKEKQKEATKEAMIYRSTFQNLVTATHEREAKEARADGVMQLRSVSSFAEAQTGQAKKEDGADNVSGAAEASGASESCNIMTSGMTDCREF